MAQLESGIYTCEIVVTEDMIDDNGHVNNVVYVQWMQDVAIAHSKACGGYDAMKKAGGGWVARSHQIEYLRPSYLGEQITARTWVDSTTKVRSLRKYEFSRDQALVARGETDWVYIDPVSERPIAIPDDIRACYSTIQHG